MQTRLSDHKQDAPELSLEDLCSIIEKELADPQITGREREEYLDGNVDFALFTYAQSNDINNNKFVWNLLEFLEKKGSQTAKQYLNCLSSPEGAYKLACIFYKKMEERNPKILQEQVFSNLIIKLIGKAALWGHSPAITQMQKWLDDEDEMFKEALREGHPEATEWMEKITREQQASSDSRSSASFFSCRASCRAEAKGTEPAQNPEPQMVEDQLSSLQLR